MVCLIFGTAIINKTSFWKSQHFFQKRMYTHARTPPPPVRFCSLFSDALQLKYGYIFPFLFLYFLISFLHIPYPACRHLTSFFLFSYPFPELFYTVLRGCFFYHVSVFPYFSVEFFGIRLEDFILPVKFVTFIKSPFRLCFYLYFLL